MYRRKTIQITIAFSSEAAEVMKRRCNALQVAESEATPTHSAIAKENPLQESRGRQTSQRWRETNKICYQQIQVND